MNIAVYSGSFNPLHIGHLAIMRYLTDSCGFDMVYLVVSPQNPFKDAANVVSAQDRYLAAVKAVERHPELKVHVDDIELRMPPPHYTIRTLDALSRREPQNRFTLVVGADNLVGMHGWRDFRRILGDYGVAVFPRTGYDLPAEIERLKTEGQKSPSPYVLDAAYDEASTPDQMRSLEGTVPGSFKIRVTDAPTVDISSTRIREGLAKGEDISMWLM